MKTAMHYLATLIFCAIAGAAFMVAFSAAQRQDVRPIEAKGSATHQHQAEGSSVPTSAKNDPLAAGSPG